MTKQWLISAVENGFILREEVPLDPGVKGKVWVADSVDGLADLVRAVAEKIDSEQESDAP